MRAGRIEGVRQRCRIPLPDNFRTRELLAFHSRDPEGLAERVSDGGLQKGLTWDGQAARLVIVLDKRRAEAELVVDGNSVPDETALAATVRRMLGLNQAVDEFETSYRSHAQLGPLLSRQTGLRVPLSPTPWEALTWAVTGQQISLAAAVSLRRNLIRLAGRRHSSGLACYPDARRVAALSEPELRKAGFSKAKAQTLLSVSRDVVDGRLPLEARTSKPPVEDVREALLAVRGIGPWTVDYTLLRGYGWLDGSLHGDVAVRRKLQQLLGAAEAVTEASARRWLAGFSPYRALVAAHLWAMPA